METEVLVILCIFCTFENVFKKINLCASYNYVTGVVEFKNVQLGSKHF